MLRVLMLCFLLIPGLHGQPTESSFLDGVKAYENENFEKAQEIFSPLVQANPQNPVLLYNLGLAEYQLGRFGKALGLWRKARFLDQSFQPVQNAIEYTEEKLFPDQGDETFIVSIYRTLQGLPIWFWCGLSLISFFLASFLALEYGVKKRLSVNLWPSWVFLLIPVFLFTSFFAVDSYLASTKTMATIIERNQLTHANPSETSPTLSEMDEGQKVYVEKPPMKTGCKFEV